MERRGCRWCDPVSAIAAAFAPDRPNRRTQATARRSERKNRLKKRSPGLYRKFGGRVRKNPYYQRPDEDEDAVVVGRDPGREAA